MIRLKFFMVMPGGMTRYDDRKVIRIAQEIPDEVMRARQAGYRLTKVEAEII